MTPQQLGKPTNKASRGYDPATHPRYYRKNDTRSSQGVYNDWRKANPNRDPEDHYLFARDRD